VFIKEEPIRIDILAERIRQMMVNRADKQVYLRGDGEINLQELMDVLARLKEAGIVSVGIVSKLPGER